MNVPVVPLQECEEEFDTTKREAKFAIRFTDLGSWTSSSAGGNNTDTDPKLMQHWASVVHFSRGKKTYLFEAGKDENGLLLAYRAEGVAYQLFENATYFATIETSPHELLMKAKQVPTGHYDVLVNNCQTWLKYFLRLVSSKLIESLHDKVPKTVFSAWQHEQVPDPEKVRETIYGMYLRSFDKYLSSIGRIFLGLLLWRTKVWTKYKQ